MSISECKDERAEYPRVAMGIIGIGDYGIEAINRLKQGDIRGVKYSTIDSDDHNITKRIPFLQGADVVFVIAQSSSSLLAETIALCKETSYITILLMPDDVQSGKASNASINKLKGLADTIFVIPRLQSPNDQSIADEEYKQVYCCVKALTDICGDRPGYANTDLGDIAGSLRNAGLGYIGFGEATAINAIGVASDQAIGILSNKDRLQNARSVIATISCPNCSIEDSIPLFDKISEQMNGSAIFNYNIYPDTNPTGLCTVIILVVGEWNDSLP